MYQQEHNRLETTPAVADLIHKHLKYLEQDIQATKQLIHDHFDQHPGLKQERDLLTRIPGIGETTAAVVLAEIQSVNNFASAKQLAAYIGLSPSEYTSGSSVRGKTQLSRTGSSRLRKALYLPAVVAKNHNPLIRAFCERLRLRGQAKMQVIAAAMRKLVHIIYGVLKSNRPFDPNYLEQGKGILEG